jgi:RNase H-fold protein (predicted Holliday junction resolvase)
LIKKTVLAIDPGKSKCGLALVRREADDKLTLLWRKVTPREDLKDALDEAEAVEKFSMIIVGSGTTSKELVADIRGLRPSVGILVVDEKDTSLQARERYWEHNSRGGWRRLIPATLQVPPEPVDDFVALILAERVLQPK